jgi:hypothetical protein
MGLTSSLTLVQFQHRAVGVRLRSLVLELTADSGEVARIVALAIDPDGDDHSPRETTGREQDEIQDHERLFFMMRFLQAMTTQPGRRSKPRWPA